MQLSAMCCCLSDSLVLTAPGKHTHFLVYTPYRARTSRDSRAAAALALRVSNHASVM